MIPQDFVDNLIQKIDILDIVGKYVELKRAGSNYLGLCPFHNEKSPSFTVSPQKNFYHCFGCGESGNSINFLKNHLGLTYIDSVKHLADIVGLIVPNDTKINIPKEDNTEDFEALNKISLFYQQQLKANTTAIDYLKNRGLTGIIAKNFAIGYAPDAWHSITSLSIENNILQQTGMLSKKNNHEYDKFRHRIMFPIRNVKGQTIAFGGRVIDSQEPKYLNSPETKLFNKSNTLYGIYESMQGIKQAKKVLVVEGYMDVIALHQYGVDYVVATLGTACTLEHVLSLFRYTQHIIFSFDGDSAGERAALKALERVIPALKDDRTVEFLFLPKEYDPDSFIRNLGIEAFERSINNAIPLSKLLIKVLTNGYNLEVAEDRAKIMRKSKMYLKEMPQTFLKQQIEQTIWGMTNSNNKIRKNISNKWSSKNIKRVMLEPIDKLIQSIFKYPHLIDIINADCRRWINYNHEYMHNFWEICTDYKQSKNKDIWLNSSFASFYNRLMLDTEILIEVNQEYLMEQALILAKSIAKQGIHKKQHEIILNIEKLKLQNKPYETLWQEYQELAKIIN